MLRFKCASAYIHAFNLQHLIFAVFERRLDRLYAVFFIQLWISLRRYNDKFGFLLSISAALGGVQCSIKYSFRENELIR